MYREELELPETFPDYSSLEYWDRRYTSEKNQSYDWLLQYTQIKPILYPRIHDNRDAEFLILGCGNSKLPEDLHKDGYKNQTCVDFSSVVIT
jgi:hypothetical protein